jgi:hypothetical protein
MAFDLDKALPYLSPAYSAEDTAPLRAFGSNDAPITRKFSQSVNIQYMVDEPGAVVFIRERDIGGEGRDELHTRALANLRRYMKTRRLRFEPSGTITRAKLDGQHDANLLLLDELWDPPTRIVDPEGELLAAVPSRGVLLFAGSATSGAESAIRAAIARTSDRELSPELFVRRRGMWEAYDRR